ncbi:MAG: hypothetical protein MJ168_08115 [Clostridia bacterium]|nr:hypothetical protein [Clostridia bacterium]
MIEIICKKKDSPAVRNYVTDSLLNFLHYADTSEVVFTVTNGDFLGEEERLIDDCLQVVDVWQYSGYTWFIDDYGLKVYLYLSQLGEAFRLVDSDKNNVLPKPCNVGIEKIYVSVLKPSGKIVYDVVYMSGKQKRKRNANRAIKYFIKTHDGTIVDSMLENCTTYLYK